MFGICALGTEVIGDTDVEVDVTVVPKSVEILVDTLKSSGRRGVRVAKYLEDVHLSVTALTEESYNDWCSLRQN